MGSPATTPQSTDSTNSEVIQTTSNTNEPIVTTTPEMTEEQKNIQICEQIASNYAKTHIYTLDDFYVCGNTNGFVFLQT
jgi:hypothetical protein